ncbi:DUF2776 family protein, partial [Escherichia coli]|uniref:DUF2776 family protein n=1 Tax=Escherichia coli TaxID=562 RepID=UPI003F808A95
MNIYIGWLFKLIPLIMGLICIALGGFVLESSGQSEYFVAGHVLISLAAICLALFTTAFIIISQLTRGVNTFYNTGNDSNLLIVFYVQIMPDDFVMQLHR